MQTHLLEDEEAEAPSFYIDFASTKTLHTSIFGSSIVQYSLKIQPSTTIITTKSMMMRSKNPHSYSHHRCLIVFLLIFIICNFSSFSASIISQEEEDYHHDHENGKASIASTAELSQGVDVEVMNFAGSEFSLFNEEEEGEEEQDEEEDQEKVLPPPIKDNRKKKKVVAAEEEEESTTKPKSHHSNKPVVDEGIIDYSNYANAHQWPSKYPVGSIRDQFTKDFHRRCDKYSFVHRYYQMLEGSSSSFNRNKYLIFVYHDRGLRNGGFGDRMGGMITAFIHAMRMNRTLIIKASNGMHDMFRPYHPRDVYDHIHLHDLDLDNLEEGDEQRDSGKKEKEKSEGQYLWSNAKEWSKFSEWKQSLSSSTSSSTASKNNKDKNKKKKKSTKKSEEELGGTFYEVEDMTDCVSNMEEGFTEAQTSRCAIDHFDNEQARDALENKPVIRFASNRAYLCRYANLPPTIDAYHEVFEALNIPLSSLPKETDFFEVAGCMLRLMMWPTNELWREVDLAYEDLLVKTYQEEAKKSKSHGSRRKGKKEKGTSGIPMLPEPTTSNMKKIYPFISHLVTAEKHKHNSSPMMPFTLHPNPPLLVGLHFRCGDRHSYAKFLLNTDGFDEDACVVSHPDDIGDTGDEPGQKSKYLRAGNPAGIGQCANYYLKYFNQNKKKAIPADDPYGFFVMPKQHIQRNSSTLLFITSDNIRAEEQMRDYAKHAVTITSPQGCHIEYDPSKACYVFTTRYWFMLALSDIIISQTFGELNAPTSAFSRYAGIYRLHQSNPFRSGRYCGDTVHSWQELSRFKQANWFC